MNKKANLQLMLFFFMGLFLLLFVGVILAFGSTVINWTFDEVIPQISNLGQVGDANLTQVAEYTIAPVNNVVQNFTWITGVLYFMLVVALVGGTVAIRVNPSKWLMGFFFALMLMLIFAAILISNIYEDFYTGTNEIAIILQEHTIISHLILYSPAIFTILGFIMGIMFFSGIREEGFT